MVRHPTKLLKAAKDTDTQVGALSVKKLHNLVIDASHIDQKKRGIMDMKDTMMPLAKFLARTELKERYEDGRRPLRLLFY